MVIYDNTLFVLSQDDSSMKQDQLLTFDATSGAFGDVIISHFNDSVEQVSQS